MTSPRNADGEPERKAFAREGERVLTFELRPVREGFGHRPARLERFHRLVRRTPRRRYRRREGREDAQSRPSAGDHDERLPADPRLKMKENRNQ